MRIIGIDFETTGLKATEDRIIEVGACLYDWPTRTPLQLLSEFVNPERPIPEEITKLTGITGEMVEFYGISEKEMLIEINVLAASGDYMMAFNGSNFDHPFYLEACKRLGIDPSGILWLDASSDIKFAPEIKTRNLQHLAAEHLILNPFRHRAVFDVLTMFKIADNRSMRTIKPKAVKKQAVKKAVKTPSKPKKKLSKKDPNYYSKIGAISAARRKLKSDYFSEMAKKSHGPKSARTGYFGGRKPKDAATS